MSTAHAAAELLSAVLPVTALREVKIAERDVSLSGSGCHLNIIDVKARNRLCSTRVLERHAIHGVIPFAYSKTLLESSVIKIKLDVIVFGGKQITWTTVDFTVCENVLICCYTEIINKVLAKDWILACKQSENSRSSLAFITSYNALYHLEADESTGQLKCQSLTDSIGIFLYSANLTQIEEKSYLIASGTVFGQVLLWACVYDEAKQTWNAARWIQFNGHRGSIFGVDISQPRMLHGDRFHDVVSCSDDRMICVWRLPALVSVSSNLGIGVSSNFQQFDDMLAKTYGHLSRIWNVSFSIFQIDHNDPIIVSVGEDAQVQSWSLHQPIDGSQQSTFQKRYIDRHHAGKNIWAQCQSFHDSMLRFVSGGADGQIVSRYYSVEGRADSNSLQCSQSFKDIQKSILSQAHTEKRSITLKGYIATNSTYILAFSDTGQLLRAAATASRRDWEVIAHDSSCSPLVPSLTTIADFAFFIRTSDHTFCALNYRDFRLLEICSVHASRIASIWVVGCPQVSHSQDLGICAAVSCHGSAEIEVYWIRISAEKAEVVGKFSVRLPTAFEVTSVSYDEDLQILICGSRAGALAVSRSLSSATPKAEFEVCKRRVHGQDTVTSICKLRDDSETHQSFYLTTGRDGTYCIHKLVLNAAQDKRLTIVHQITPPIGTSIEGAHIIAHPSGRQSLLLYGFQSKFFVVWDETSQTQVMNVDCGGAHRSWMFNPDRATGQGGTFIWTKASTMMVYEQTKSDHEIIQTGGHGREIKALATHQIDRRRCLIATGSEDTDIRLFECSQTSADDKAQISNTTVLRRHTTGLQDLRFSRDGKILISAAGMEELYAWSLSPVPIVGQGVVFACALSRSDNLSDARIVSIDMQSLEKLQAGDEPSYVVVAAYSNGKLNILRLNCAADPAEMRFDLLHTLEFGTICLTQAHICESVITHVPSRLTILVGATNGSVQVTNMPVMDKTTKTSPSGSTQRVVRFDHKIHQNSITALQSTQLGRKYDLLVTGGDDNALALTLITRRPNHKNISTNSSLSSASPQALKIESQSNYTYKSLVIPKAHAAALTALSILPVSSNSSINKAPFNRENEEANERSCFHIISAGNDQAIQVWYVTVDTAALERSYDIPESLDGRLMEEVEVQWLGEWYTDVADISGMDVLNTDDDGNMERLGEGGRERRLIDVLIVGVGMEVLRLDLSKKIE